GAAGAVVGPAQPFPENGLAGGLAVRAAGEVERRHVSIEGLLIVVPAVFAAAGGDPRRKLHAEPPAGDVEGVNPVVAELAVPPVPFPVPFVVDDIVEVRPLGGRALPELPVEPGRNRRRLAVADFGAAVGVPRTGVNHAAELAVVQFLDPL